jgi:hypothetical protein
VFGQLALFGRPVRAALAPDLVVGRRFGDGTEHGERWASTSVSGSLVFDGRLAFPAVGMLVRLDDPLLPDVVRVTTVNLSFGGVDGAQVRIDSLVLPGTAAAWTGMRYGD